MEIYRMTDARSIGLYTPAWPGAQKANGIASAVHFLATGLDEAGHRPVIVTPRIDGEGPTRIPVILVEKAWSFPERLQARIGLRDVAHQVMGRQIAEAFQTAIRTHGLHAVIMDETQGWAGMVQDRLSVPVIATLHGPWFMHKALQSVSTAASDRRRERREAAALLKVAGVIAPSQDVMDATLTEIPELKHRKTGVIRNALGFEDGPISASQATQKILFVGRYDYHKGGDLLLKAFVQLARHNTDATLTFVGPDRGVRQPDGSPIFITEALESMSPAIRARVHYMGQQDRQSVAALRRTHPIAVIASRYENLNYTMLEAMAAGQALIATNAGGPREVLKHGDNALLVPPGDANNLAAGMTALLQSPEMRARLGRSARETLKRDFCPVTIARQTIDFLSDLSP
jgi:glycosyltransferase involved in cell wall biosynthesis